MEVMSAPKSVLYGDQLPLGLEAKATKKLFFPTTGDNYSPDGNKTIRIDVNYDGMLDTQQSFLQFTLSNTTAGEEAAFDLGQPVIKKLTISSGGVVLEEISDYNTLYSNILLPSQAGDQTLTYERYNRTGINFQNNGALNKPDVAAVAALADPLAPTDTNVGAIAIAGAGDPPTRAELTTTIGTLRTQVDLAVNGLRTKIINPANGAGSTASVISGVLAATNADATTGTLRYSDVADGADTASTFRGVLAANGLAGSSVVVNYKLVSGLLDNDKYLPLVLMNAGITIEIELEDAVKCMLAGGGTLPTYSVNAVRYVGHTIDLQRDFYDRLRMVQQNSGGVLQIVGQSFRTFRGQLTAGAGEQIVNCPARVRSIKSFFFCGKKTDAAVQTGYSISKAGHMDLSSYQLAIGATRYPPTATQFDARTNKNGAYTELMKAFGKVGSTTHRDILANNGYILADATEAVCVANSNISFAPFGVDLERFRHQIENGIDTSSRALPIQLHLNGTIPSAQDLFMFVLYDTIFYINMDGSVSVSS